MLICRAYRLKLYANRAQRQAFARSAGSCRWLWDHLLKLQQEQYEKDGTFVFFHAMSKLLPGLKQDHPWLAETPSNALVRVCRNLDRALRNGFRKDGPRKGFPRFKAKGQSRDSFYVIGQAVRVEDAKVVLPKVGAVRFRAGRLPEGRIVGGSVSRTADDWFVTLQCEMEGQVEAVTPVADTVVAADAGLRNLLVASDWVRVAAARPLRKAQKRLRRAQRTLSRRQQTSANRRRQARKVARIHARVADIRRDTTHKGTRALVDRASAVVTETLTLKGMARNPRLALSVHDAGIGEALRQIAYKCEWAGKVYLKADRWFASTQTCSRCDTRKVGADKLLLHHRTFRCDACGFVADRDDNAAGALNRFGVRTLCPSDDLILIDIGRVTPERTGVMPVDACGDPSAGPAAPAAGRRGSPKQEAAAAGPSQGRRP